MTASFQCEDCDYHATNLRDKNRHMRARRHYRWVRLKGTQRPKPPRRGRTAR